MNTAPKPQSDPRASPCIGVCVMDAHSGLCRGCARTLGEIAEWGMASEVRRQAIWQAIALRRAAARSDHQDK